MSDLADRQALFMECLGKFLALAPNVIDYQLGYKIRIRLGEGYVGDSINKPTEDTPHMRTGSHFNRLGIDLIIDKFEDNANVWTYQTSDTVLYDVLGHLWLFLNPLCRWGGDFSTRDYNHFSITFAGVS